MAIRSRHNFQRTFDLPERVIPERWRSEDWSLEEGIRALILRALEGHGWATIGTLADTWRLKNVRPQIRSVLEDLASAGDVVSCDLMTVDGKPRPGWVRPADLELAAGPRRSVVAVRPGALAAQPGGASVRLRPDPGDLQAGLEAALRLLLHAGAGG